MVLVTTFQYCHPLQERHSPPRSQIPAQSSFNKLEAAGICCSASFDRKGSSALSGTDHTAAELDSES